MVDREDRLKLLQQELIDELLEERLQPGAESALAFILMLVTAPPTKPASVRKCWEVIQDGAGRRADQKPTAVSKDSNRRSKL
jgi:hypothetical protein